MRKITKIKVGYKWLALLMKSLVCLAIIYVIGWFILFNHSQPSYLYDAEDFNNKKVVAGPLPKEWVIRPTYHGTFYTGDEWPFVLYKYFCNKWAAEHGYSKWD